MRVQIAQLSGVTDIHLLYAIFGLTATTMLFGWLMESMNGRRLATYYTEHGMTAKVEPGGVEGLLALPVGNSASRVQDGYQPNGDAREIALPVDWTPFVMGFIPHAFAWTVVLCFFFQTVSNGDPPGFVWVRVQGCVDPGCGGHTHFTAHSRANLSPSSQSSAPQVIIIILFVLDLLFAVNQFLQFSCVRGWRGFARAEFNFILLSLTSKQLLAWIEFGGTKSLSS